MSYGYKSKTVISNVKMTNDQSGLLIALVFMLAFLGAVAGYTVTTLELNEITDVKKDFCK